MIGPQGLIMTGLIQVPCKAQGGEMPRFDRAAARPGAESAQFLVSLPTTPST